MDCSIGSSQWIWSRTVCLAENRGRLVRWSVEFALDYNPPRHVFLQENLIGGHVEYASVTAQVEILWKAGFS